MEDKFIKACINGDLVEINRLLRDPNLNVHAEEEHAFRRACQYGHLSVVNILLGLTEDRYIDVHTEQEYAFRLACSNGHIQVVNRLLGLTEDRCINVHAEQEEAFRWACMNGHIQVANRSLEYHINVHTNDKNSFHRVYENNYLDIVNRLLELRGERSIKLSDPDLKYCLTNVIKILIIKALLKKMRCLKLLDELLEQKTDVLKKKEMVMGELKAIPGGQDYIQAESSFITAQLNS